MIRSFITVSILFALMITMGGNALCAVKTADNPLAARDMPSHKDEVKQLAQNNNEFALKLYKRLTDNKKNVFLSPYSISAALAMTYVGARGATAKEMAKVMNFKQPDVRLHAAFSALITTMNAAGETGHFDLTVANRLFGAQNYKFKENFLLATKEYYHAPMETVNFSGTPEGARKRINDWVEKKTKDRIKNLLPKGVIKKLTRLVLVNAIYFKSSWRFPFEKSLTKDGPFHITKSKKKTVKMMRKTQRMRYGKCKGAKVLAIPYKGNRLSMIVFLPDKIEGIYEFEKNLTAKKMHKAIKGLRFEEVKLKMPRFGVESKFMLADQLKAMGMKKAFDDKQADFSGMSNEKGLRISNVIHQAFVKVDEKGTEAAAATAVVMLGRGAPMQEPKVHKFHMDHPFLFLIRDNRTGSILFMGRVVEP